MTDSFELIGKMAGDATDNTIELKKLLENSKYKDIFNFVKYGNWVKTQVIEPIEEIYELLRKNREMIQKTIGGLEKQIENTTDPSLQKPLILQKDRLMIHIESLDRVIKMLEGYREKLKI